MKGLIQVVSNSDDNPQRPGRKPIHEEVRRRLVETGLQMAAEHGFRASLSESSFSEIIDRSGVSRATAYRALSEADSPAEWLDRELLKEALRATPGGSEGEGTALAAMSVFEDNAERLDGGDARDFTDVLREIIRVGAIANHGAVVKSIYWRAYMATAGALATQGPEADPEMLEELRGSERSLIDNFATLYETVATTFGLRLKQPYSWEQFATMLASMVEGLAMRVHFSDNVDSVMRDTGRGGEMVPWNLLGIGTEALVLRMTDPIPGMVSANLSLPDRAG